MSWILDVFLKDSVGQALLVLCLVIVLGMILGSIRIFSVNVGVAGVLFVGILFGHFGVKVNPVVTEFARDLGLILFVYSIGQEVGPGFVEVLLSGGLRWIFGAALITVVPLVLFSLAARVFLGLNFLSVCGLLAGSMTDPPALAYANSQEPSSDGPSTAFVAVYPLTMLLRVFAAQALILFFSG